MLAFVCSVNHCELKVGVALHFTSLKDIILMKQNIKHIT